MRRLAAILFLIAALTPLLWLRTVVREPTGPVQLRYPVLATSSIDKHRLGPFRLEKAWSIEERKRRFGGLSGLVAMGNGRLLAVSDAGLTLEFSVPDAPRRARHVGSWVLFPSADKYLRDVEAATADLETGKVWLALEFSNLVVRNDYRGGQLMHGERVKPPAMSGWGNNSGPETFARLADGRFLAIREGFTSLFDRRRHEAVLFASDPIESPKATKPFTFVGPSGYSPTDAVALPDGRVLVLLRRVVWPMPPRFAGALALGDPKAIREGREWPVRVLATWQGGLPVDNFEGIAVEPQAPDEAGSPLTVWLISDSNNAALQRTVLWKLRLDPARLSPRRKAQLRRRPSAPS